MQKRPSRHLLEPGGGSVAEFRHMLPPERVVDLSMTKKEEAITHLIELTAQSEKITDTEAFKRAIFEREAMLSTDVGHGVGIPHVKIPQVEDFVMTVGRSAQGIEYGSRDGKPVYLMILIGANDSQSNAFLKVLAKLMTRLKNASFRNALLEAETTEMVHRLLTQE